MGKELHERAGPFYIPPAPDPGIWYREPDAGILDDQIRKAQLFIGLSQTKIIEEANIKTFSSLEKRPNIDYLDFNEEKVNNVYVIDSKRGDHFQIAPGSMDAFSFEEAWENGRYRIFKVFKN